jgi:hypothetical protein
MAGLLPKDVLLRAAGADGSAVELRLRADFTNLVARSRVRAPRVWR